MARPKAQWKAEHQSAFRGLPLNRWANLELVSPDFVAAILEAVEPGTSDEQVYSLLLRLTTDVLTFKAPQGPTPRDIAQAAVELREDIQRVLDKLSGGRGGLGDYVRADPRAELTTKNTLREIAEKCEFVDKAVREGAIAKRPAPRDELAGDVIGAMRKYLNREPTAYCDDHDENRRSEYAKILDACLIEGNDPTTPATLRNLMREALKRRPRTPE